MKNDQRGIVLKSWFPALIMVVCLAILVIFDLWKLPFILWMEHREARADVPSSGIYVCEELDMAISFGENIQLFFPDGTDHLIHIDYGCNIGNHDQNGQVIRGSYTAYLSRGYVELSFTELPLAFKEGKDYRFYLLGSVKPG